MIGDGLHEALPGERVRVAAPFLGQRRDDPTATEDEGVEAGEPFVPRQRVIEQHPMRAERAQHDDEERERNEAPSAEREATTSGRCRTEPPAEAEWRVQ